MDGQLAGRNTVVRATTSIGVEVGGSGAGRASVCAAVRLAVVAKLEAQLPNAGDGSGRGDRDEVSRFDLAHRSRVSRRRVPDSLDGRDYADRAGRLVARVL